MYFECSFIITAVHAKAASLLMAVGDSIEGWPAVVGFPDSNIYPTPECARICFHTDTSSMRIHSMVNRPSTMQAWVRPMI